MYCLLLLWKPKQYNMHHTCCRIDAQFSIPITFYNISSIHSMLVFSVFIFVTMLKKIHTIY